jgi:hypothetical protein
MVPAARLSTSDPSTEASESKLEITAAEPLSRYAVTGPAKRPNDDSVSVIVSGLTMVNE